MDLGDPCVFLQSRILTYNRTTHPSSGHRFAYCEVLMHSFARFAFFMALALLALPLTAAAQASGIYSTVGGGNNNAASGNYATVGGGNTNTASGTAATVAGGRYNSAVGSEATVSGGGGNIAWGTDATIAGGDENAASGVDATVGGGFGNSAGGDQSWAGGKYAYVRSKYDIGGSNTSGDAGTFIWADSTNTSFVSTGSDQFLVRAGGGVAINGKPFYSNAELTIYGSGKAGSGDTSADLVMIPRGATTGFDLVVPNSNEFDIFVATATAVWAALRLDSSGNLMVRSLTQYSDARLKRNIQPLEHVLDRLLQLRGVTFEYKNPDGLHPAGIRTGFIAQEVQDVFPDWVGHSTDGYLTVGPHGFEALSVEALRELRAEKDGDIAELRAEKDTEIGSLRAEKDAEIAGLNARVERLEARVGAQPKL